MVSGGLVFGRVVAFLLGLLREAAFEKGAVLWGCARELRTYYFSSRHLCCIGEYSTMLFNIFFVKIRVFAG